MFESKFEKDRKAKEKAEQLKKIKEKFTSMSENELIMAMLLEMHAEQCGCDEPVWLAAIDRCGYNPYACEK